MLEGIETKEAKHTPEQAEKDMAALKDARDQVKHEGQPERIETKEGGTGAAFNTPDWMDD